ncbi:MAG: NAD(P)H-dependent glycerol-3-phosphate dehydrogenase [Nitrospirae bacterium]|nr:NAD(P)H-dependent glycerol-3-phosphate dehydrogenase [Nitrospirota bacterium]
MENIAVIGGGGWGTALAFLLADKGYTVRLWVYEKELAGDIQNTRENKLYLPGVELPENIAATSSLDEALAGSGIIVFVVPSQAARSVLKQMPDLVGKDSVLISCTKGIENDSLMLMSDVIRDVFPAQYHRRLMFLSGPSFAEEVSKRLPTAVSLAGFDNQLCSKIQKTFTTPYFKVFTSSDVTGVQLGGALKNVIALASGGSDGLGFGHNTRAALITRGLAEITRLGVAMGADPVTFAGLSGMGDLVLTCTGHLSRNRMVGYKIGQGIKLSEILENMKTVAEGVKTTRSAYELAKKYNVRMPIVEQIYAVLFEDKDPRKAVSDLMEQDVGGEVGGKNF